ncbi:putative serine carboxypeptidase (CBP1) [Trypanosoma cruzi]|uniref:Putative serine carboxypeptidase (CBP1) n=1 Tax=Trypanosoma cruzi TaxID=5693 RepID=A0A2V2UMJ9_TRYCR|nr:putative serine carboxypeptidase (CBP1) [Trypanosoma cruzi]
MRRRFRRTCTTFSRRFLGPTKKLRKNKLFVVGESYGGTLRPCDGALHQQSQSRTMWVFPSDLLGLRLATVSQTHTHSTLRIRVLAWGWCREKLGEPCVSEEGYQQMSSMVPPCQKAIEICNSDNNFIAKGGLRHCKSPLQSNHWGLQRHRAQ